MKNEQYLKKVQGVLERTEKLLEKSGLTANALLASDPCLNPNVINSMRGRHSMPSGDIIAALAKALQVSVEYLLNGPSAHMQKLMDLLGDEYTVKRIDYEDCIYRKLNNFYDLEVSGVWSAKMKMMLCIWDIRQDLRTVEYVRDISSKETLLAEVTRLENKYKEEIPPEEILLTTLKRFLGEVSYAALLKLNDNLLPFLKYHGEHRGYEEDWERLLEELAKKQGMPFEDLQNIIGIKFTRKKGVRKASISRYSIGDNGTNIVQGDNSNSRITLINGETSLSDQESALLQIFSELDVVKRSRVLSLAAQLADN